MLRHYYDFKYFFSMETMNFEVILEDILFVYIFIDNGISIFYIVSTDKK